MDKLQISFAISFCCWLINSAVTSAAQPIDFNRDIRPLLSSKCYTCHGPDEEQRASDLRLDTQDGSRIDLGGYAAIIPGNLSESELLSRVTSDDEELRMPPAGNGRPFTDAEVQVFKSWIEQGATYAKHWSYEKPERPSMPQVNQVNWPINAIDYFVLARLEAGGLRPSKEASRLSLARRVAIDLTGLPPTWEEAEKFASDQAEGAYSRYVDRQLAKPSFGERWARVWLDLARYADSAGYADDPPRTIWAYRDYVIRALNSNLPFDQFTLEQIAGDLLKDPSEDQLIATAFHRNTMTNNEGGTNDEEFRNVAVIDRVNTTMAVWMGTTMACAQCHSHKYDPISQEEYFQFFAFFNNSADADIRDEQPFHEIWTDQQLSQKVQLQQRIDELKTTLETPTQELDEAQKNWLNELRAEPKWEPIVPSSASAKQRNIEIGDDGWVAASGKKTPHEKYTIEFSNPIEQLAGLRIEIPSSQQANFVLSQVQARWKPKIAKPVDARYVRIELPGEDKIIHLAEVQAFNGDRNLAIAGKATQSSTGFDGKVEYAIDGNTDGIFTNQSVTHTKIEKDPWLEVDLQSVQRVDRIAIWNRTDNRDQLGDRLAGFRILLLDDQRNVVWQHSPGKVPDPSSSYFPDGSLELVFSSAYADFSQDGFTASSVLQGQVDAKKGWAIGGQTGQEHELTLVLREPQFLGEGTLLVQLNQGSSYDKHLLDSFRVVVTGDQSVSDWAQIPEAIRELVRSSKEELNDQQGEKLASHFRTITPLLGSEREELAELEVQLSNLKPYTTVPVMKELAEENRRTTKLQLRGNYQSTAQEVAEATPSAFHPLPVNENRDRLALAKWLVDKDNPLTARVIANRHWEQLFGTGIVESSEEFGSQGELPTHPRLLDWLAVELRDSGWDLKHLLKMIVTSATYRQSSVTTAEVQEADPFNRLLARGPRFRISAEMIRDQALFVSGLLSDKMYGPPVKPPQPELGLRAAFGSETDWKTSEGDDRYRRGIYTTWRRSSPYPSMAQFDAPNREVCTIRRIRTNTPLQALVTLNDPVYVEAAQALARRMVAAGDSVRQRIEAGFHVSLIRKPTIQEIERLSQLAATAYLQFQEDEKLAIAMASDPLGDLPDGSDAAELAAWTVVANVILNLDEIFLKR